MSDKILASAPGDQCCSGVQHFGEPKGTIEKIAGVDTYVVTPPQGQTSKGVILFYADVWGPLFINNKLIQDYFASQGLLTFCWLFCFTSVPRYLHLV